MRRGPAIALAVVAAAASLLGLLAAGSPRPRSLRPLPDVAVPAAAAPLPRACGPSYAYDRLADRLGGQPQRMGLDATAPALPGCLP